MCRRELGELPELAGTDFSAQMASGKGTPGAGLQIPLERDRSLFVGELHDDVDLPWPPTRGVKAAAGIVRLEAGAAVTGDAGVITPGVSETPKNIDAASWDPHTRSPVQVQFRTERLRISARGLDQYAESATPPAMNQANSAKHNAAFRQRSSKRAVHRRGRN